ncbi:MAG: OmpA family protein [Kofleriaceae bacterium]
MARSERGPTESGVLVYPKMPLPKRESEPRMPGKKGAGLDKMMIALLGGTLVAGVAGGVLVRPLVMSDSKVSGLEDKVEETQKAVAAQKTRADNLEKDVDTANDAKKAADQKLAAAQKAQSELAVQAKEAESKAQEAEAAKAKLAKVIDPNVGIITADGEGIRVRLVDKVLFKTLDDQLTDRGKQVLDRVATALKEIPDKQIWVQGHTDDQPIVQPPAPRPAPPKKGQKPVPVPAGPVIKFATNWELSSARALTVVHYLQDVAKVDPGRLAALAFGQYRPFDRRNRAANRRIEIVLYPKPVVNKK